MGCSHSTSYGNIESALKINEQWLEKKMPALDTLVAAGLNLNDLTMLTYDQHRRNSNISIMSRKKSYALISPHATRIFENEQEILLFKTLNLIRHSPDWVIPHIKRLRSHKHYKGENLDRVVKKLRKIADDNN